MGRWWRAPPLLLPRSTTLNSIHVPSFFVAIDNSKIRIFLYLVAAPLWNDEQTLRQRRFLLLDWWMSLAIYVHPCFAIECNNGKQDVAELAPPWQNLLQARHTLWKPKLLVDHGGR